MFNWLKKRFAPAGGQEPDASHPDKRENLIVQATAALNAGDLVKAAQCYQQAILLNPDDADIRVGLSGALIGQGAHGEARTHLNRAILLDPGNANAYFFLGKIEQTLGDLPAAIELYNEALELKADFEVVHGYLTTALLESGQREAAEAMLLKALSANPRSVHLHLSLGTLYSGFNGVEKAEQCYRSALAINPESNEAHNNLGVILLKQGQSAAAIASFKRALQINEQHVAAHSNLLLAMSLEADGLDGSYLKEARRFGQTVLARAKPCQSWFVNPLTPGAGRALRVGLVSGDLRRHALMSVLEGVLKQLNPAKLDLIAYSMNPIDDEVTARIKGVFSKWIPIGGLNDEAAARQIHADGVDILIDLAGHSAHNRLPLFAWKPAPVQVSWLGYLASTGVPGIDYVLADPVSAPKAVWDQFTEEIWHLPETFNCFTPPAEHPKLMLVPPPALRNGYVTFGSFQRINKLSDATLQAWGRIFGTQPQAKMRLRNEAISSEKVRNQLLQRLEQAGIAPARVTFGESLSEREDYLAAYGEVDLILDTFPYPGVTTTCEALWMGVPTVTLAQGAALGRIGASLLTCAGLAEWVAWSEDEYVALAQKHAADVAGLARLRAGLRRTLAATPLFDPTRFALQLEQTLLAIWQQKMTGPALGHGRIVNSVALDATSGSWNAERINPNPARLGGLALAQGDLRLAASYYLQAVQQSPGDADAGVALGYVLTEQGRHTEAKPYLEAALRAAPSNPDACYLLGKVAHEARDLPAVIDYFTRALDLRPEFDAVFSDLAALYFANREQKPVASAIVDAVRHRPARGLFHHYLGNCLDGASEFDDAITSYREALVLRPVDPVTHCNLGHVLLKLGDDQPAATHLRRAIEIKPDYFTAHSNLLWMLSFCARDVATEYVAEARRYGRSVTAAARPFSDWTHLADGAGGRLRVGLVSGDFRAHPIGYFLEGILKHLNPAKLELIAYSMNPHDDAMTERMRPGFAQWSPIKELSDEEAARKIHADGVDILIDVAGHSGLNRLPLFAWRPAPLQVSWFGYLASTGVPGIDYVLADAVAAPDSIRGQFTEQIWHLPETLNCYTPPPEHPTIAVTAPPALRNGYITFGSCQRLNKLSDATLKLWQRVMLAMPQAKLRLQNGSLDHPQTNARLRGRLIAAGISPERCILRGAIDGKENHLAAHSEVDIVLDTPGYPGTTTTCEALWMGVPTLTLAGDTLLRRVGASVMTCAGLGDWVAWSEEDYVALAVRHGSDVERLARLRAGLRQQVAVTALFDAGRFAPQLEEALFGMWQRKMTCSPG